MSRVSTLLLLIAVAWPSAGSSQEQSEAVADRVDPVAKVVVDPHIIPFRLSKGLITVDVMVNGKGPFLFSVDTGAGVDGCIDLQLAKQLELGVSGTTTNKDGAGASAQRNLMQVSDISIGGRSLGSAVLLAADYSWVRGTDKNQIHGIIGYDLLSQGTFLIDYPGKLLVLQIEPLVEDDKSTFAYKPNRDGMVMLPITIGATEIHALLDTGCDSDLALPSKYLKMLRLDGEPEIYGRAVTSLSEFDLMRGTLVEPLQIGPIQWEHAQVNFAELWQFPLVGFEVLKESQVTIDRAQNLIRLVKPE